MAKTGLSKCFSQFHRVSLETDLETHSKKFRYQTKDMESYRKILLPCKDTRNIGRFPPPLLLNSKEVDRQVCNAEKYLRKIGNVTRLPC